MDTSVNPASELGKNINTSKSKRKKKQDETGKKKKDMIQSTLDKWLYKPKRPTRVQFKERVLLKEFDTRMVSWTTVPLKGISGPWSVFAHKRQEIKRTMALQHRKRRNKLTRKNARRVTHILERLLRENTKLGY